MRDRNPSDRLVEKLLDCLETDARGLPLEELINEARKIEQELPDNDWEIPPD